MNPPAARYADDPEKGPQVTDAFFSRPDFQGPRPGYQAVYQPPVEVPQDHPRNNRRRRFWHFFACTFLFIGALHLWLGTRSASKLVNHIGGYKYKYGPSQCSDVVNWTKSEADRPREMPYYSQTSLTLPLSAVELFFVSEGAFQYGNFEISQDFDVGSDDAVVDVHVSYRHPNALDDATVCRIHQEGDWGLGIFTPHWRNPHHERALKFHVHLRLPAVRPDSILKINSLRTDLPLFSHHLPKLADSVYFERLGLHSTNAPIGADSVAGNGILFHAENAGIRGTFNASSYLTLETSNAPINVFVNLMNGDQRPTVMSLITSNGRIDGEIALASNTSTATRGKYWTSARTSNAPLHVSFVEAPLYSSLTVEAHTANSPAEVTLHKTFEGTFDLTTSTFFVPEVQWAPVEDPAGRDRKRHVRVDTVSRSHVRGGVAWDWEGEQKGQVTIKTSNSPLRLKL